MGEEERRGAGERGDNADEPTSWWVIVVKTCCVLPQSHKQQQMQLTVICCTCCSKLSALAQWVTPQSAVRMLERGAGYGHTQLVPRLEPSLGGMSIHAHTQLVARQTANRHPAQGKDST